MSNLSIPNYKLKLRSVITHPAFILLVTAILTYWPISFMVETLKWDMLDVVFPWRHFVGECLQNGIFPFWNPYQATGYPIHADPQCPVWSPELWITGILTGYNIYILHILFIFYIFLAGYGMYRLVYWFNQHKYASLLAGISFMLSGFFVSHGQHFFAIIGGAFIPYVLLYYLKTLNEPNLKNSVVTAIFIFLLGTGGYQTLTIITGYLLLTLFLYTFFRKLKQPGFIVKLLLNQVILIVLVTLLILVVLIPYFQVSQFSGRLIHGLDLQKSFQYPFSPQSLISLILPFSTVKNPGFFKTDFSMNNIYFGLLMFIVFTYGLFRDKKGLEKTFLIFGLVSLLASFGNYLPVRKFLFTFFPFMNQFRMPSYFSYFAILSMILSTGIHLPGFFNNYRIDRKRIMTGTFTIIIFLFGVLAVSFPGIYFKKSAFISNGWNMPEIFKNSTFYEHLFLQSLIQLGISGVFLFVLINSRNIVFFKKIFAVLVILDMIIAVNLNGRFTVWSPPSPRLIHQAVSANPKGFPLPYLNNPIIQNKDMIMKQAPFWRNMGNFTKYESFDAFSSFPFDNYQLLDDSLPNVRDAILNNPLVYTSGLIFPYDSVTPEMHDTILHKHVFVPDTKYRDLIKIKLKDSKDDHIKPLTYEPGNFLVKYKTKDSTLINLLQSDYTGWQVYLDEKPVPHFTSNYLYISAVIPPGEHTIRFIYRNKMVLAGFFISYSILIILLFMLAFNYGKSKSVQNGWLYPAFVFLFISFLFILFYLRKPIDKKIKTTTAEFANRLYEWQEYYGPDSLTVVLNTDDSTAFSNLLKKPGRIKFVRYKTPGETGSFWREIEECRTPYFAYGRMNLYQPPGIKEMTGLKFPCKAEGADGYRSQLVLYKKSGCTLQQPFFKTINNFDSLKQNWSGPLNKPENVFPGAEGTGFQLDSTHQYSPAFRRKYSELSTERNCYFILSAQVLLQPGATPFLVFQTRKHGVLKQWHGFDISKSINYDYNKWKNVVYVQEVNRNIQSGEVIEIYAWNKGKQISWINRFAISVYPTQ